MIGKYYHLCGGSLAGQAYTVCSEQGCSAFALCCSGQDCDCLQRHRGHHMIMLRDILDSVMEPANLPDDLRKMEKDIDVLLDELILNLQQLKAKHHQHIDKHIDKQFSKNSLMRKLKQREPLEIQEGSGDSFHRLNGELRRLDHINSPYRSTKQQLTDKAAAIRAEMTALSLEIEQLWASDGTVHLFNQPVVNQPPESLKFSATLKHHSIQLHNGARRATGSYLAVLEPRLSMNTASRISFRINKVGGDLLVGVCCLGVVQQLNYRPSVYEIAQGVYMQNCIGFIYSDSFQADNNKQLSSARYSDGKVVTVRYQPITGTLTYECDGKSYSQRTAICALSAEPVHFCVGLADSDVSIE